ncbi:hypothetical protein MMC07_005011 [Pseudocyphellaria aurata]|nr:hypothetical protein [Pseudocyphellaria aurata]
MAADTVKPFDQDASSAVPAHLEGDNNRADEVQSDEKSLLPSQSQPKDNETPRLSSDRVQALEDLFVENPKPCSTSKKQLAEQLNLSLTRVSNWFQNRRTNSRFQVVETQDDNPELPGAGTPIHTNALRESSDWPRQSSNIEGQRLVSDLHLCCIRIFDMFRQNPSAFSSSFNELNRDLVDEQSGRLFLWGQGFDPEKLEGALDDSKELKKMVLESLYEIGKLLVDSR